MFGGNKEVLSMNTKKNALSQGKNRKNLPLFEGLRSTL